MGILDDAIREHLDLKRKHGVPEEEVERQQEDALGPARRDVAQQPENAEIAADAVDDTSLVDGEQRAPGAEAPAVADDETPIEEPPPGESEPAETPAAEAPLEADPHEALGDTEPHGFPALEEDDLHEEDDLGDDDSHDEPLPASDADDELDVLEDTPDFLQETPEHDRLWFEQKPPRDFDFD